NLSLSKDPTIEGLQTGSLQHHLEAFLLPMKDPSRRWISPGEFDYWAKVYSVKTLSKKLQRTPRTIRDWLRGARPIPAWTVAVLRLHELETEAFRRTLYPIHKKRQLQLQLTQPDDLGESTQAHDPAQ
ncbi:hypothetical protein, partial [Ralstonia sp. OTU4908]|uniref:hypothetical protein n=1 Tax=Ralstonia sp. OTU4908 TaxID=3043851 RepID=UPI00313C2B67